METVEFPKVWSANAALARDIWKYSLHDDTGRLSITDEGFSYQGEKQSLTASWENVRTIRICKQDSPWALHLLCVGLTGAFLIVGTLSGRDFLTMFFILLPVFGALYQWMREAHLISWAVVEYDASDQPTEVWLAEVVGWWGNTDGTKRILEAFRFRFPIDRMRG